MTVIIGGENVIIVIHGLETAIGIDTPIGIDMGITTVTVASTGQATTSADTIPGDITKAGKDELR
jgi:hypothetical protein